MGAFNSDKEEVRVQAKVRKDIEAAILIRAKAKALDLESKRLSDEAKGILLPIMAAHEIKSYALEGVGKVSVKINSGSSINRDKLVEALLINGVAIGIIESALAAATKSWLTEYVDFVGPK